MVTPEQLELFASLFRGRTNVHARYWEKDDRSGYSPNYAFDWDEFMAHKRNGGSIKTFEHKTLVPLDRDVLRKHLNGQLLAKIISFDTARNRMIADDIMAQVQKGEKVLVLSERKEHLDILRLCLKGKCETVVITGDDTAPQRVVKIARIKRGGYQVLLSTGQFFGEGLDVKNISVLVLAFPFSFEGKLIQYIGRLLHSTDPKLVIDYRDKQVAFLERQYKKRQTYYNKLKTPQTIF